MTTGSPKAINQTTGDTRQVVDHKRETLHLGNTILPSLGEPVVKANIITSIDRIKAERQAIRSARIALESVDVLFRVGIRTIVDVLVAQRNLFNAQLSYTTNVYSYILATLQLKYATGTLSVEDILQINSWLHDPPPSLSDESMVQ